VRGFFSKKNVVAQRNNCLYSNLPLVTLRAPKKSMQNMEQAMQRKIIGRLIVLTTTFALIAPVLADTTAEDAKDYRISIMTTLRGHIGASSMTVRGLVDDHGQLAAHADGLANGVAELKHVFQEGSIVDDSEALPVIWEQPEKFAAAMKKSAEATVAFQEAVSTGDSEAIGAAFRNVGMSCRGCHDDFRVAHD
jgi:cytochrome c556